MPEISLIIPLYNARRHLRACLDSVLGQTFAPMEVLLVNDGSTDDTAEIAAEYCRKDARFRLINKENGGVSDARNRGLSEASAPYVAFLDQDDMLHPQAMEILFQTAEKHAADVAMFQITFVPDDFAGDDKAEKYDAKAVADAAVFYPRPMEYFFRDYKGEPIYIWNKLYRRGAIQGVEFPVGVQPAEDTVFTLKALLTVKNIAVSDRHLLYYRQNEDAVSRQGITEKYVRSHARAAAEMERFFAALPNMDRVLRGRLDFYLSRFIFKSLVSQPLRKIKGEDRARRLEDARAFAAGFYRSGALKPNLLGMRKALACRLFFAHHDRAARFLV